MTVFRVTADFTVYAESNEKAFDEAMNILWRHWWQRDAKSMGENINLSINRED